MFAKKLALIVVFVCIVGGAASSAVPPMISYQGKLMQPNGTPVPDGTYSIQFSIYDAQTGGNTLWSEVNPSVQVKGGLFATMLGSVVNMPANIFDSPTRFFGIKVGSDPEMIPRQQVATVAFAVKASSADTATTVPDASITTAKLAPATITADKLAPGVAIPPGTILMWSGATNTIPLGWALCDGTNGTPNLRDQFIVGAGLNYTVGATGGVASNNLAHTHHVSGSTGATYIGNNEVPVGSGNYGRAVDWDKITHAHSIDITSGPASPDLTSVENRPPYYALCFIMKQGY